MCPPCSRFLENCWSPMFFNKTKNWTFVFLFFVNIWSYTWYRISIYGQTHVVCLFGYWFEKKKRKKKSTYRPNLFQNPPMQLKIFFSGLKDLYWMLWLCMSFVSRVYRTGCPPKNALLRFCQNILKTGEVLSNLTLWLKKSHHKATLKIFTTRNAESSAC